MRPFTFEHAIRGGLHRHAHTPGEDVVVDEPNWDVLSGDWPDDDRTPHMRYAVNATNTEEVAVYLGLIWRLTEGRSRFAIPRFFRDDAVLALGRGGLFVGWEYAVDATLPDADGRDKGFVPARSVIPTRPEPSAFEWEHRNQAGLFELRTFEELAVLTRSALGDASAEVSVIATERDRLDAVVDVLRSDRRPELRDLLAPGDVFVDLTIGVDAGYTDSVIVYAREDLSARLGELTREYEGAITAYEARVPEVTTVEGMLDALDRLAQAQQPGG